MTEREVYNEGRDGYANGLLVGANPYPNQCPELRQLWGRGWYDKKHDVLTHFPCTPLEEDMGETQGRNNELGQLRQDNLILQGTIETLQATLDSVVNQLLESRDQKKTCARCGTTNVGGFTRPDGAKMCDPCVLHCSGTGHWPYRAPNPDGGSVWLHSDGKTKTAEAAEN